MPYFPPQLLQCVCFLGYRDNESIERVAGSAFWVCRHPVDEPLMLGERLTFAYLVTAAHVIDEIRKSSSDNRALVRVNTKEGGQEWIETYVGCWKTHPDNAVDIAVMKFGPGKQFDHICWMEHTFVGSKDIVKYRIELADEVYFPGLFWPHTGKRRNIPIVRVGNIACLRGEKVATAFGDADAYLVEARSIGGLSGSPVFIDLFASRREPKKEKLDELMKTDREYLLRIRQSPSSFRLLGVMHGHFRIPYGDTESHPDSVKENEDEEREKLNMGIAIVIPAEKILEVITQFMAEEAEEIAQYEKKKRSYAVPDSVPGARTQTQKTAQGTEIPVPSTQQFFSDLEKASRRKE